MISYTTAIVLQTPNDLCINNAEELAEMEPQSQPMLEQLRQLPENTMLIIRDCAQWATTIGNFFAPRPPRQEEEDIPF